jgi:hypothetical protein
LKNNDIIPKNGVFNMDSVLEKNYNKKVKKLNFEEKQAIKIKAKFIMTHSKELLEKMEDDVFVQNFLGYLLSNNLEKGTNIIVQNKNLYDYSDSLNVIFKLCYILPELNYSAQECENFRNKLRLYTKYFYEQSNDDSLNNKQYVKINVNKTKEIIANEKINA